MPRLGGLAILAGVLVSALVFLPMDDETRGILGGALLVTSSARSTTCTTCRRAVKLVGQIAAAAIPVAAGVRVEAFTLPFVGVGGPRRDGRRHPDRARDGRGDERRQLHRRRGRPCRGRLHDLGRHVRDHRALARPRRGRASWPRSPPVRRSVSSGTTSIPPASSWATPGSNLLGLLLACIAVQGVLKTAAVVALVFPLVVLAVPILDTAFVVAKRFKYRRPAWEADTEHFHHRMARIGFSQRRTVLYLYLWTLTLSALALALRFVPYSDDHGNFNTGWTIVIIGFGVIADRRERLPGLRARDPQVPPLPRAPAGEAGGHHPGRRSTRRSTARSRPASSRRSSSTA